VRSRVVDSISSVDADRWDRLAAGNLYLSHEWLTWLEPSRSATARYAVVTGGDGEVLAAAPYYTVEREHNELYRLDVLGLQPETGVLMGARNGYRNGVLAAATAGEGAVRSVVERVCDEAGGTGWWLYVTDDAVGELCEILGCPVPVFLELEGRIPLPGHGWDDFCSDLPPSRRQAVRRERRTFAKAGYAVSMARLDECWYDAGALLANVQNRYGHGDSADDTRGYLASLAKAMTYPGSVLLCRRGDRLVGYCHFYDFGRTRWIRTFGLDYSALAGAFEYFELAYYLPIAGAYAAGLASVHCGIKSPLAKAVRGARLCPLWAVPVGAAAVPWPAARCRAHNRAALTATRDSLGYARTAVDDTRWADYV
jgi:hypothetical protein